ncbi:hypothetical protein chiPu_0015776 [Chiloscyllium punctatum]|uniref:Uncharacterized protein n=1 Tax=Chiloscyllium punctatum TaxID=137246 RepID=A0A401T3N3_CHIPU|nr:hypothetical protein [Chiloscyllium punctatum]
MAPLPACRGGGRGVPCDGALWRHKGGYPRGSLPRRCSASGRELTAVCPGRESPASQQLHASLCFSSPKRRQQVPPLRGDGERPRRVCRMAKLCKFSTLHQRFSDERLPIAGKPRLLSESSSRGVMRIPIKPGYYMHIIACYYCRRKPNK